MKKVFSKNEKLINLILGLKMQNSTANSIIQLYITGQDHIKLGLTEKGRLYSQFAYEKLNKK